MHEFPYSNSVLLDTHFLVSYSEESAPFCPKTCIDSVTRTQAFGTRYFLLHPRTRMISLEVVIICAVSFDHYLGMVLFAS
jgi:hypothetical protein